MAANLIECPVRCGRRHKEGHPHLEARGSAPEDLGQSDAQPATGNVAVVGADSPEALAAQVAQQTSGEGKKGAPIRTRAEVDAALQEARINAMRPMARRIGIIPYSAVAIATFDYRWRQKLMEDDLAALESATINAMLAWGIEFSGKWSSLSALALCHAESFSRIFREISAEDAAKKKAEQARNVVTENTPPQKKEGQP